VPFLVAANSDKEVSHINVFTLNHDRLIEEQLEEKGIPFQDGFSRGGEDQGIF
jgi:hypothetical protein